MKKQITRDKEDMDTQKVKLSELKIGDPFKDMGKDRYQLTGIKDGIYYCRRNDGRVYLMDGSTPVIEVRK